MKKLIALFAIATLTATAGIAQARENISADITATKYRNRRFKGRHVTAEWHCCLARHNIFAHMVANRFKMHSKRIYTRIF